MSHGKHPVEANQQRHRHQLGIPRSAPLQRQRSLRIQCSPAPGVETEQARLAIASRIEQIELPEGYTLDWQGEKIASTKSMKYLFKNFPLAIILMIAILIMLFKDYRKPIIIFCSIPLVFGRGSSGDAAYR